jgi:CHAT domain-containing protein
LLLEDEARRGVCVNGQRLGILLNDHHSLRLAILNACDGARTSRHNHFAGAAQSLVQKGIPAVIAMQFGITDKAAILFAQQFYRMLAEGRPLDTALAETRKTIFTEGHELEWGTPVLYMRSPQGRLFDITPAPHRDGIATGLVLPSKKDDGAPVPGANNNGTDAALLAYLNAGQNGQAANTPLRKPLSPGQKIFRQMYRAQVWNF